MLGVRKCLRNKNRGRGSHVIAVSGKAILTPLSGSSASLKKNSTKAALSSTLTLVSRNLQSGPVTADG